MKHQNRNQSSSKGLTIAGWLNRFLTDSRLLAGSLLGGLILSSCSTQIDQERRFLQTKEKVTLNLEPSAVEDANNQYKPSGAPGAFVIHPDNINFLDVCSSCDHIRRKHRFSCTSDQAVIDDLVADIKLAQGNSADVTKALTDVATNQAKRGGLEKEISKLRSEINQALAKGSIDPVDAHQLSSSTDEASQALADASKDQVSAADGYSGAKSNLDQAQKAFHESLAAMNKCPPDLDQAEEAFYKGLEEVSAAEELAENADGKAQQGIDAHVRGLSLYATAKVRLDRRMP